jgi:hypothetical protein
MQHSESKVRNGEEAKKQKTEMERMSREKRRLKIREAEKAGCGRKLGVIHRTSCRVTCS